MSDFVNPTTRDLVASVSDMPPPWQVCTRAQLTAWQAIPTIYRKWVTDHIEEMDAGEKATTDAALLTAARDSVAARLDGVERIERAFALMLLDELNAHSLKINAILDAIDAAGSLAALKTSVAAIADQPTRTAAQLKTALRGKLGS
jgi:hypothetical protein